MSQSDAEKREHALVTSKLDYSNFDLSGFPKIPLKSLQMFQNAAARVLMRTSRSIHISYWQELDCIFELPYVDLKLKLTEFLFFFFTGHKNAIECCFNLFVSIGTFQYTQLNP